MITISFIKKKKKRNSARHCKNQETPNTQYYFKTSINVSYLFVKGLLLENCVAHLPQVSRQIEPGPGLSLNSP